MQRYGKFLSPQKDDTKIKLYDTKKISRVTTFSYLCTMKYNSNATNNTIILNLKTVTIMKKFFTLIAAALLSSGAFAQSEWQNMITNGDMEGEQDPMWSSFWCHDYRQNVEFAEGSGQQYDENGQFQGFAEIIDDPLEPGNHCARVIARSEAEADEAGNKVEADGKLASWGMSNSCVYR